MKQNRELEVVFIDGNRHIRTYLEDIIEGNASLPRCIVFRTLFELEDYLDSLPKDKRLLFIIGDEIPEKAVTTVFPSIQGRENEMPYIPHQVIEGIKGNCRRQGISFFNSVVWTDENYYTNISDSRLYCHMHGLPVFSKLTDINNKAEFKIAFFYASKMGT